MLDPVEAFHARFTVAANAGGKEIVHRTIKKGIKTVLIRLCFAKSSFLSENGMPPSRR
jgi:hypothetical protein